jgi:excisionase family DNA binding protein
MKQTILTAEAAQMIGVTPSTVRAMEKRGQLSALRTGGNVRVRLFDRTMVQRFADRRAQQRGSASAGA